MHLATLLTEICGPYMSLSSDVNTVLLLETLRNYKSLCGHTDWIQLSEDTVMKLQDTECIDRLSDHQLPRKDSVELVKSMNEYGT